MGIYGSPLWRAGFRSYLGKEDRCRLTMRDYMITTEHCYLLLVFGWISSEKDIKNPHCIDGLREVFKRWRDIRDIVMRHSCNGNFIIELINFY